MGRRQHTFDSEGGLIWVEELKLEKMPKVQEVFPYFIKRDPRAKKDDPDGTTGSAKGPQQGNQKGKQGRRKPRFDRTKKEEDDFPDGFSKLQHGQPPILETMVVKPGVVLDSNGKSKPGPAVTNSGAGMRPGLIQKPAQTAMVQEDDDYSDIVFTQTQAVVRKMQLDQPHQDPLRNKVISLLKSKGAKMNSAVLSVMAMKLAADPFAKVKTLIQQLIERLVREKTDEATQKGWCDTELAKAEHDRWYRHTDTESLSSNVGVLEARKASLETKASELKQSIKDLNKALTDASNIRSDEKSDNKATLTNASEGLEALKQAITVLKDFYRKSSRAKTSLLQKGAASPVDQDFSGEKHLGAYKGNQAQAEGILGMLATIQNDFEKTIKETTAAENQAHRDFVKFSRESKASISSQTRGLEQTENDLAKTNADLVSDLNSLKDNQKLLDSSLKTLETLRPACIDTGMTWDEKVARRTAEIDALKNALCVLDEEDNDIPECSGKLFLQK